MRAEWEDLNMQKLFKEIIKESPVYYSFLSWKRKRKQVKEFDKWEKDRLL